MSAAPTAKVYAGIGSRRTPAPILLVMTRLAERLASTGWVLRSGHANGADQAFEDGANAHAEIYLPWTSFNADVAPAAGARVQPSAAEAIAAKQHPAWKRLSKGPRALHARNVHQILGVDLQSPARFVVCWTPDATLDGRGPDSGGTGQALRIAAEHAIPVFNLARADHLERVTQSLALTA